MLTFDAVVIGSGPAGLNASLYLVRAGLRTALIEKNSSGGQVLSTSEIENYLGFPKGVKGWELADLFTAHVNEYDVEHIRGEVLKIETIEENGAMHVLHMQNGDQIKPAQSSSQQVRAAVPSACPKKKRIKARAFLTAPYATATFTADWMSQLWVGATPPSKKRCIFPVS